MQREWEERENTEGRLEKHRWPSTSASGTGDGDVLEHSHTEPTERRWGDKWEIRGRLCGNSATRQTNPSLSHRELKDKIRQFVPLWVRLVPNQNTSVPFWPHMEENKTNCFVNESLETMLLLLRVANIYANASDILKNKKECLVKKDWFIGKLKYLKCRHWALYVGLRPCDYHNYRMVLQNWPTESTVKRGTSWNWPFFDSNSIFGEKGAPLSGENIPRGTLMCGTKVVQRNDETRHCSQNTVKSYKVKCKVLHLATCCLANSVNEMTTGNMCVKTISGVKLLWNTRVLKKIEFH